jgi:hypothetical protein
MDFDAFRAKYKNIGKDAWANGGDMWDEYISSRPAKFVKRTIQPFTKAELNRALPLRWTTRSADQKQAKPIVLALKCMAAGKERQAAEMLLQVTSCK